MLVAANYHVWSNNVAALQSMYNGESLDYANDIRRAEYWENFIGTVALGGLIAGAGPLLAALGAPAGALGGAYGLLGTRGGLLSGYHAYGEFQRGNYITGTLDAGVGVLSLGLGGNYMRGTKEPSIFGVRVAPFGNAPRPGAAPNKIGKWPHYHRGVPDPSRPGHSLEGQGVTRHRQFETKSNDTSFWDRF